MKSIADALEKLANVLSPFDVGGATYIRKQRKCTPQQIADDLSIWGGPGSLMDQSLCNHPRSLCLLFEAAAIELGHALIQAGANNKRMEGWVHVFESWSKNDA
jgi:hypothetical protein